MIVEDHLRKLEDDIAGINERLMNIRRIPGATLSLDNLSDVVLTGPLEGEVLTFDEITARWINEAGGGGGGGEFLDNFADADRHWAWRDWVPNGSITEAGGVLTISSDGDNCDMWGGAITAPVASTGIANYPLTIETKISNYVVPFNTQIFLYISPRIAGNLGYGVGRTQHAAGNGVCVTDFDSGIIVFTNGVVADPIWFRIRKTGTGWGGGTNGILYFYYSINGVDWTLLHTVTNDAEVNLILGLLIKNWSPFSQVNADFEYVKVTMSPGPG